MVWYDGPGQPQTWSEFKTRRDHYGQPFGWDNDEKRVKAPGSPDFAQIPRYNQEESARQYYRQFRDHIELMRDAHLREDYQTRILLRKLDTASCLEVG